MKTGEPTSAPDPFNLARFLSGQQYSFELALAELRRGQKENHWMWYIFPQLDGLGISATSKRYAIRSLDEARAYLNHPILGPRLIECCRAILSVQGKSALQILGFPDDMKLKSSMTLFSLAGGPHSEFTQVLERLKEAARRFIWPTEVGPAPPLRSLPTTARARGAPHREKMSV